MSYARLRPIRKKATSSEPYFLYVHYIDPHKPYHERSPWYEKLGPESQTEGEDLETTASPRGRAKYDSEIGYVDSYIRDLFLEFGWQENTLLIVTSDHGEQFYEHGHLGHGWSLYDEVMRIPLLVYDSTGRIGPGRVAEPVGIIDILPSLMDYLGIRTPSVAQGKSFLPLLLGKREESDAHRYFSGYLERYFFRNMHRRQMKGIEKDHDVQVIRSATRGPWKLIVDNRASVELYNTDDDPGEKTNVIVENPEVAAEMAGRIHEFILRDRTHTPVEFTMPLTAEEIERLRSLGYVD